MISKRSKNPPRWRPKRYPRPSDASLSPSSGQSVEDQLSAQTHRTQHQLEGTPGIDLTERQHVAPSESHELWNAAYDSLKEGESTAKLVASYERILKTVSGADVSAELGDPTKRQIFMKKLVVELQAKISMPLNFTKRVGDVAGLVLLVDKSINAAIRNILQAALPWAGVCFGMQILLDPAKSTKSNLTGIARVISRMDWYCALTEHLLNKDCVNESFEMILPQLRAKVLALYRALLKYQMKSVCSYYRHQGLVFLRGLVNLDDWDKDLEAVKDAEATLQMDSEQYSRLEAKSALVQLVGQAENMERSLGDIYQTLREFLSLQKDRQLDDIDRQCRWDLRVVDPKDDMKKIENKKDTLLPDVYEWILNTEQYAHFMKWNDGLGPNSCQLLWVKGHAGTGKTMLLMGIIHSLEKQQDFGAPSISYFFCQGTDATLNNATAALRSLVWMLLVEQPHLISHLRKRYEESGAALFQDPNAFFALSEVFLSMLKDPEMSPALFVVDALDECNRASPGLDELIHLISDSIKCSSKVKWLLSSRPEINILKNSTGDTPAISENMVELDAQCLEGPVEAYISHQLTRLRGRAGYDESILEEVSNEIRQRAMNTFLWVSLVFQDLKKCNGYYAVKRVKAMPSGLSDLYDHMMARIEKVEELEPQDCKKVLVCATLAFRPISLLELVALSDSPSREFTETAIELCGSFLTVREGIVYLIHQSAKEYLDQKIRCSFQPSGIAQEHVNIGKQSFKAMSMVLKQNMYGLDYSTKSKNIITPQPDPLASVRYSCVFWADHLIAAVNESFEGKKTLAENGEVLTFLRESLLHWLECLCLLGKLFEGAQSIRKLLLIAQNSTVSYQLSQFLEDIDKFIQSYGLIIGQAPLQIYASALIFTPTTSEIKTTQWKHRLPFIQKVTGIKAHWDAHLLTIEAHEDPVLSVAFSPDGTVLASVSEDYTVRLWDVATWSHQRTIGGEGPRIESLVFSPDSKKLALTSQDRTIWLWDMTTDSQQIFGECSSGINLVAFTPDGKTLVSALDNQIIQLWNIATGTLQRTFEEHGATAQFIDFMPDGRTLVLVSFSEARLLDLATGNRQILDQNGGSIESMALSPNGKTLALGLSDLSIWLWDITTGRRQQILTESSEGSHSMAFSHNGETLVSAGDEYIQVWNTVTWSHKKFVKPYHRVSQSIAFSPDNKTLALATGLEIMIWDITREPQQILEGHSDSVAYLAFSPNGEIMASASYDKTIQLRDITGSRQQTIEGLDDWAIYMKFSPDGKILASITCSGVINLWDITTGNRQQTLKGYGPGGLAGCIIFSPNSEMLASLSMTKIQLWDIINNPQNPLEIDRLCVESMVFSPDSRTLASASSNKTVHLWDIATWSCQQALGYSENVSCIAFSPDGKTLALALDNQNILLWDIETRSYQQMLQGHVDYVQSITFSPDGRYLVTTPYELFELNSTSISSILCPEKRHPKHAVVDRDWVILNGKESLWLPIGHRWPYLAVSGNTIALRYRSGKVIFIEVDFAQIPTDNRN